MLLPKGAGPASKTSVPTGRVLRPGQISPAGHVVITLRQGNRVDGTNIQAGFVDTCPTWSIPTSPIGQNVWFTLALSHSRKHKSAAQSEPGAITFMRQHAERALRKTTARLGPALEWIIGRAVERKKNFHAERLGKPAKNSTGKPVHGIGKTIDRFGRRVENRPEVGSQTSDEKQLARIAMPHDRRTGFIPIGYNRPDRMKTGS